jgi:PDZ domain
MLRKILTVLFILAMPAAMAAGRGYLGVAFTTLPPNATPVAQGVLIGKVLPGSAAERAGLRAGQIVTHINGVFVTDPKSAVDLVGAHGAGETLSLTVIDTSHGFNQRTVRATLAANAPAGFNVMTQGGQRPGPGMMARPPGRPAANPMAPGGGVPAAVALFPLRAGHCFAMTPPGWRVADANVQASAFTVASPDGNLRASYGIVGVNSGQVAGYYGPQFRTPASFALFTSGYLFGSQASSKPPQPLPYGFQLLTWGTPNGYSGYTIFKAYPLSADPRGYIVSMYIGGAPSREVKRLVPLATAVAATIRCNTQLQPPPPSGARSEGDAAARNFNSILGTGYVHDAAGDNYYVGNENWVENGPDGPGYYKVNGNDVTKLQPGLQ